MRTKAFIREDMDWKEVLKICAVHESAMHSRIHGSTREYKANKDSKKRQFNTPQAAPKPPNTPAKTNKAPGKVNKEKPKKPKPSYLQLS